MPLSVRNSINCKTVSVHEHNTNRRPVRYVYAMRTVAMHGMHWDLPEELTKPVYTNDHGNTV
jgi:hypothetical protein